MPLEVHFDGVKVQVDGESNVFNGLDLQVKAIKGLIETMDFNFAQEDDMEIDQKTYLVLLDAIGSMLRANMHAFDTENSKNIEVVHQFLSWVIKNDVHKQPEYAKALDQKDDEEQGWD
jgi:hypothetical protein